MIPLSYSLFLAAGLFVLATLGLVINRRNVIGLLMCLELLLLAVNTNFIAFANAQGDMHGQLFVFFILCVAAAEAAIGLGIVVLLYRNRSSISVDDYAELRDSTPGVSAC